MFSLKMVSNLGRLTVRNYIIITESMQHATEWPEFHKKKIYLYGFNCSFFALVFISIM
jgi:hypothetical protein